jgi:hypothetical protein
MRVALARPGLGHVAVVTVAQLIGPHRLGTTTESAERGGPDAPQASLGARSSTLSRTDDPVAMAIQSAIKPSATMSPAAFQANPVAQQAVMATAAVSGQGVGIPTASTQWRGPCTADERCHESLRRLVAHTCCGPTAH